jgi:Tfp pilus assembly protein PilF
MLEPFCKQHPEQENGWFLLAAVEAQLKQVDAAIDHFEKVTRLNPNNAEALFNMGLLMFQSGDLARAQAALERTTKLKPDYLNAVITLAQVYEALGKSQRGLALLKPLRSKYSQNIALLNALGSTAQRCGETELAMDCFETAFAITGFNDRTIAFNLANASLEQNNHEHAEKILQTLYAQDANNANYIHALGRCYMAKNEPQHALDYFSRAVQLDKSNPRYLESLAQYFVRQRDYQAIVNLLESSSDVTHSSVGLLNLLATTYRTLLQPNHADATYHEALQHFPKNKTLLYNYGAFLLSNGRFLEGWRHYIHRPSMQLEASPPPPTIALEQLRNKHVLFLYDQGLGDELFFLRFIEQLKPYNIEITYCTREKLKPLLEGCKCIDHLILEGELNQVKADYVFSIGDLPLITSETQGNITPLPYPLTMNASLCNEWQQKLQQCGKPPYIGVTWRGGERLHNRLFKQIDITQLAAAIESIGGTVIVLQRNPRPDEIEQLKQAIPQPVIDLNHLNDDLPAMLAVLGQLREYIGVSNTNVHLRAGLGEGSRVLVTHPAEWRWMAEGANSPWFPGTKIYRQYHTGHWEYAFKQLQQDLLTTNCA